MQANFDSNASKGTFPAVNYGKPNPDRTPMYAASASRIGGHVPQTINFGDPNSDAAQILKAATKRS